MLPIILKTFTITCLGGICLVLVIRYLAHKYNLGLDHPTPDKIHQKTLPRIGGVALYGAFIIGLLTNLRVEDFYNPQIIGVIVTTTLITGLGFWDDLVELRPRPKFLGQLGVAILAVIGFEILIRFINNPLGGTLEFGYFLGVGLSIFWLLGTMNVTNLLDGLDGLATGVTAIFAIILLLVAFMFNQRELVTLATALFGASLAFLLFNFSPAKIFMGDSGSMFLGLLVGELSILAGAKLATVMLILAIPIMDTAYTIFRRLRRGVSFSQKDTNHLHHQLIEIGLSQRQVCLIYYLVAGTFGFIVLIPVTWVKIGGTVIAGLIYLAILFFINKVTED